MSDFYAEDGGLHIPSIKLISIVFFIELENLCENDWKKNGENGSSRGQANSTGARSKAPFVKLFLPKYRIIQLYAPIKQDIYTFVVSKMNPRSLQWCNLITFLRVNKVFLTGIRHKSSSTILYSKYYDSASYLPCFDKMVELNWHFLPLNNSFNVFQSEFQPRPSTKIALLKIISNSQCLGLIKSHCCIWHCWPQYVTRLTGELGVTSWENTGLNHTKV